MQSLHGKVGLFFVADGRLLLHTCTLDNAERYGDFVNYPESHDEVWQREYAAKFGVDFDYYPRGRIVYNRTAEVYRLYHDPCVADTAELLRRLYPEGKCTAALDEHYQCRNCNPDYVR